MASASGRPSRRPKRRWPSSWKLQPQQLRPAVLRLLRRSVWFVCLSRFLPIWISLWRPIGTARSRRNQDWTFWKHPSMHRTLLWRSWRTCCVNDPALRRTFFASLRWDATNRGELIVLMQKVVALVICINRSCEHLISPLNQAMNLGTSIWIALCPLSASDRQEMNVWMPLALLYAFKHIFITVSMQVELPSYWQMQPGSSESCSNMIGEEKHQRSKNLKNKFRKEPERRRSERARRKMHVRERNAVQYSVFSIFCGSKKSKSTVVEAANAEPSGEVSSPRKI